MPNEEGKRGGSRSTPEATTRVKARNRTLRGLQILVPEAHLKLWQEWVRRWDYRCTGHSGRHRCHRWSAGSGWRTQARQWSGCLRSQVQSRQNETDASSLKITSSQPPEFRYNSGPNDGQGWARTSSVSTCHGGSEDGQAPASVRRQTRVSQLIASARDPLTARCRQERLSRWLSSSADYAATIARS
jgi:hypothetical protein